MKPNKTVKLIEKIFPSVKDDLKNISNFAKENPLCNYAHLGSEYETGDPDPSKLLDFKSMVESLIDKIKNKVLSKYEISLHNAYSHFDPQMVVRGFSGGPGYIHIEIKSEDDGKYCFSYSGYVWNGITLVGRILKSGKMKSGSMSYGGNFLFDDSIKRIQGEREIAKAKKEKDKSKTSK